MMPGGRTSEATVRMGQILSDLRYVAPSRIRDDESGFVRSDACSKAPGDQETLCLSRPISLADAEHRLEGDLRSQFLQLTASDPTMQCTEIRMAQSVDGYLPKTAAGISCAGEHTTRTTFESFWPGVQPNDVQIMQLNRLAAGDTRGFATPQSWELGAHGFMGIGPGNLVSKSGSLGISRAVILDNETLQVRLGLTAGYLSNPFVEFGEGGTPRTAYIEGVRVSVVPEMRLYTGANLFFTFTAPTFGHIFAWGDNHGGTIVDAGLGVGYGVTNKMSLLGRATLTLPPESSTTGGVTVGALWRL